MAGRAFRAFRAKHPGTCVRCGDPIRWGQQIEQLTVDELDELPERHGDGNYAHAPECPDAFARILESLD